MGDVFISYSRLDKEFVVRLHDAFQRAGRKVWVDWEGIPPSAEWMKEIHSAIEDADAVLFVVSSHSAVSSVCVQEVLHAAGHNKRLIPVVLEDINPATLPQPIAERNWIFFRGTDDFSQAMALLLSAIDVDLDWTRRHTRLLTRAIEWQEHGSDPAYALHGSDLRESEHDLVAAQSRNPRLTDLQIQYVLESRRHTNRRRYIAFGAASVAALVIIVVGFLFWQKRHESDLNLARDIREKAMGLLNNGDPLSAEVYFAHSLTIDNELETRQLLLQARAKSARLLWASRGDRTLLGVSPDGKRYLAQSGANLELWDIFPQRLVQSFDVGQEKILAAAFSKDMQYAAVGSAAWIEVWRIGSAQSAPATRVLGAMSVTSLAISPDGKLVVVGAIDGTISLIDTTATNPAPVRSRSHTNRISSFAFTSDGQFLVSGSWDNSVKLWAIADEHDHAPTLKELHTLLAHDDAVLSIAISADDSTIASGSWDNHIWLWDRATGQRLRQLRGHAAGVVSLAFSADGKWLASGSEDRTARIWTVETGRVRIALPGLQGDVTAIAFAGSPSDPQLAAADENGTIRMWDIGAIDQREEVTTLRGHQRPVNALMFNPQQNQLASGSWDRSVRLWNLNTGQQRNLGIAHADSVTAVAFSPDGLALLSAGKDGAIRAWDVKSGSSRVLPQDNQDHPVIVRDIAFSPDGKLIASANDDGHVRIWDASAGILLRDFPINPEKVLSVAFSPDGRSLAAGNENGQISVWHVSDWSLVFTLSGHTKEVWQVVFSPDGRYLFSASDDRTVRIWDLTSGRETGVPLHHDGPVWSLDVSPDGKLLLTGSSDSTAHLWDIERTAGGIGVTHRFTFLLSEEPVWKVAFSRRKNTPLLGAIAGADTEIHVLDFEHFNSLFDEPQKLEQQAMDESGLEIASGSDIHIVARDRQIERSGATRQ